MESVYVWLLFLSGTTLVGIGVFVFASDLKSRKQQGQLDQRRRGQPLSETQRSEARRPAESVTTNKELLEKIASLSSWLEEKEKTLAKLQNEQRQLVGARYDNHELQGKIANLTKQLHINEARLSESGREIQRIVHRNSHLQAEVAALKQQLQASQTRIQEFEVERERLLDQLRKTESILATAASQYKEVTDRDSQLESELAQTRERGDQLTIRNKELLAEIDSLSKKLTANPIELREEVTDAVSLAPTSRKQRKWHSRMIPVVAAIAILGAIAVGFVGTSSNKSFGSKEPAPDSASDQSGSRIQSAPDTLQRAHRSVAAPKNSELSKKTVVARSEPRLKGAFKTIHPTELFTGPTEDSALITTLLPGTKINVVDSRRGWLEIRSEQPRRSGFVRQESAVRIERN